MSPKNKQKPAKNQDDLVESLRAEIKQLQNTIEAGKLEEDIRRETMKEAIRFMSQFKDFPSDTTPLLIDIGKERARQDAKWGEQNWPDGTGGEAYVKMADHAKLLCDTAAKEGKLTYKLILAEEVAEAFAESDEAKLEIELNQVSAVATAWRETIRRRRAKREADAQTQQG